MSQIDLELVAAPATPAASVTSTFLDTVDRRLKSLDGQGVLNVLPNRMSRDFVRNGGFWFAQRQAPATATTYSSVAARAITADGWGVTNQNASVTYQRTDAITPETGLKSQYYGNFVKITATGKVLVSQVIESRDTMALRGRTVRVTAWMRQVVGVAPVVRLGLAQLAAAGVFDTPPATFVSAYNADGTDPTLGANIARITPKAGVSGDNCTVSGNAASCTLSAVWQRFSAVFDVPLDCKNLIPMFWGNAQFAATNGFAISQVQLTDGFETQDWTARDIGSELARVQRYFQKTFNVDTLPAQNIGANTGEFRMMSGTVGAVASTSNTYMFTVPMRLAPSSNTFFSPASIAAQVQNMGTFALATVSAFAGLTERGCYLTFTGDVGNVVGASFGVHMTFSAEM